MKRLKNKAGFTLAELLIVVAIIAILVAIGVPAFSTAMERSRETVDLANIRGAYAEYMADTLSSNNPQTIAYAMNFKQRTTTGDTNGWIVDVSGFTVNLQSGTMPTPASPGDGYAIFSYGSGDEKPSLTLQNAAPATGVKVVGSGS